MTNSEMIQKLETDGLSSVSDMNFITNALEENDKLKADVEQFSNELISVLIENELLKKKNELTNHYFKQYAAAIDEIKQLKSELEQSVRLPLTNADKIRSMSDEELTKNIMSNIGCSCCEKMTGDCGLKKGISCKDWIMKWLNSEVPE